MRLLLDECFDWRLGEDFEGHEVAHVTRIGWAGIKNGRLLALAQTRFDVFVTIDKTRDARLALNAGSVSRHFTPPTASFHSRSQTAIHCGLR